MKKKKIGLIILIIVIVILAIIGVLAVLYFKTDFLKTDQQLFWKYFSSNTQILDILSNENAEMQNQWKESNSYTSEGTLTINVPTDSSVNQFRLATTSQHNNTNNRSYSDMTLYNGEEELLKASYINSDDVYSIKYDDIYEAYYVGFRNSNLKQFARNMGLSEEEIAQIPDSIPFEIVDSETALSEEEAQYLIVTYGTILLENIPKDKYSKTNGVNITSENQNYQATNYSLNLNQDDIKQILVAILTKAKDDEQTIAILNKLQEGESQEQDSKQLLDELFDQLQETAFDQFNIGINIYNAKEFIRTQINLNNNAEVTIDFSTQNEEDSYINLVGSAIDEQNNTREDLIKVNIQKQVTDSNVNYINTMDIMEKYNCQINTTIGNVTNNIMENSSKVTISTDEATVEANYTKTTRGATEEVQIQELTDTNSVIINNYPMEQLDMFFESIGEKAGEVLEEKIGKLNIQISDSQDALNNVNGVLAGLITVGNANGMPQPIGIFGVFATISINETVNSSLKTIDNANNVQNEIELANIEDNIMLMQTMALIEYSTNSNLELNDIKSLVEENLLDGYEVTDWVNVSFDSTQQKLIGTIKITNGSNSYSLDFTNMIAEEIEEEITNNVTINNGAGDALSVLSEQEKEMFNSKFESSAGTNKMGSITRTMISTIITNNAINVDDDSRTVYVKIGGELKGEITDWSSDGEANTEKLSLLRNTITTANRYNINLVYNNEGLVHIVEITDGTSTTTN